MINLPTQQKAQELLYKHVKDEYQRHHALMVATAMEGYAKEFDADVDLWYLTGFLHDLDFEEYPDEHPGKAIEWFREWNYPEELIHAVEAHAYGYNGFEMEPATRLAAALLACDEICGIFYAYKKLNPIPYGEMKAKSIKKRIKEKDFARKVDRETIYMGCEKLEVDLDTHIQNLIRFLSVL